MLLCPVLGNIAADLVCLWAHEMMRVFHDRLINETDRNWVLSILRDQISMTIGMSYNALFGDISPSLTAGRQANQSEGNKDDNEDVHSLRNLLYCNFEAVLL
jgi:dynein heavy chain, axonemal